MCSVVIMCRINIGVIVSIIEAERNLFIDIDIIHSQAAKLLIGSSLAQHCSNILVCHTKCLGCEIINRKCGMIGVETCIQHSNDHTTTIILTTGSIKDTGIIHRNFILYQLSIGLFIDLTNDNPLPFFKRLTGGIKILCENFDLKAAEQSIIITAGTIGDTLIIQLRQYFSLLR